MKYPQLVSSTTPASLQDWLEEELESRGIDGVYTRYILSLLQQDTADLEPSECEHSSLNNQHNKYAQQIGSRDYPLSNSGKAKHQRWKSWERERLHGPGICCCSCGLELDSEERKKNAAVECLKSASEQKSGIEKLIDEVCAKLKKIKTTTAFSLDEGPEKTILDNTERITISHELDEIPPSSPQEQAEKYYAAFPALSSKPEPLTKLCHQQERENISKTVWDGRKIIDHSQSKDENGTLDEVDLIEFEERKRDDSLDRQSDASEKENAEVRDSSEITNQVKLKSSKKFADIDNGNQKPSFIIPKMKTSSQRIPFSVKYLPFNQLKNKYTCNNSFLEKKNGDEIFERVKETESISDTFAIIKNGSENSSETYKNEIPSNNFNSSGSLKNYPKSNPNENLDSLFENLCDNCGKLGLLMCAALSDVAFSEKRVSENEDDLLASLAGKFNSELAAIWEKGERNECNTVPETDCQPFEISLNFSSDVNVSSSEDSLTKDIPSVWTFNKDDFRIVKDHKISLKSSLFYLTNATHDTCPGNLPKLLRNISFSSFDSSFQTNSDASKNSIENISTEYNDLSSDIDPEYNEVKLEECTECDGSSDSDSCNEDNSEDDDDLENILSACPKSLNTFTVKNVEHSSPEGSERGSTTPSESLTGAVKGVYSLWKSSSPDSLVFGMDLEKIWEPSFSDEKSNWIGIPFHEEKGTRDWNDNGIQETSSNCCQSRNQWGAESSWENVTNDSPLPKVKCTLTYHKGESRFVEVIPSKNKAALLENGMYPNDAQETNDTFDVGIKCLSVEEENLLTSPKTHFQPIRQESTDTETSDDAEVIMLTVQESPCNTKEFNKDVAQPDMQQSIISIALSSPEDSNSITDHEFNKLSPSPQQKLPEEDVFKSPTKDRKYTRAVSSSFDELISLTGHFSFEDFENSCLCSSEGLTPVKFAPLYTWKCNHYMDKGTNTDMLTPPHPENKQVFEESKEKNKTNSTDNYTLQSFQVDDNAWQLSPASKIPGANRKHTEWKWSTNDDEHVYWNGKDPSVGWNNSNIIESLVSDSRLRTIEKNVCGNLTALRKEIKEEEEQLFKDISCVNEGDKDFLLGVNENLELQKVSYKSTVGKEHLFKRSNKVFGGLSDELGGLDTPEEHLALYSKANFLEWNDPSLSFSDDFSADIYDSCFSLGECDLEDGLLPTFPSVPADKVLYSSDLEDEWRKNSLPFGVQVPRKNRIKYKGPPQKRPCSFYLEGNCRRSDCRFSHDLSTITCRFWEEGSCFKGVTCPFLHGYPSRESDTWREDNGISECKYTLESEADFPSLSKLTNAASDSKTSHRGTMYGKQIRPRRKKGKSLSGGDLQNIQLSALSSNWSRCTSQDTAPESSDYA